MQKYVHRFNTLLGLLSLFAFVLSLGFFLPVTVEFYETNKLFLLVTSGILVLATWAIQYLSTGSGQITLTPTSLGLFALTLTSSISTLFVSQNKIEALTAQFGAPFFLSLFLLSLVLDFSQRGKQLGKWIFFGGITLLSLISIYQYFGVGNVMFPGITYLADQLWTPFGLPQSFIALSIVILPWLIEEFVTCLKKRDEAPMAISLVSIVVLLISVGLLVSVTLPRLAATMLPLSHGWAIMLEILKNPVNAIFGTGPENFTGAFTAGRLVAMNLTPLWNTRFLSNSTTLLHIATIYGILGGVAFLMLLKSFIPRSRISGVFFTRLLGIVAFLLVPPSLALFVGLVLIALLTTPEDETKTHVFSFSHLPVARFGIGIVFAVLAILSGYFSIRAYRAEIMFFRAAQSVQANDGKTAYERYIETIRLNPYGAKYHMAYSQVNLALANTLGEQLAEATTSGSAINEADRNTINTLIQQAVREGKIAVDLAPMNVIAWENVAKIYQAVSSIAQGADEWTIASYQQAIQLDPTNPALRFDFGSFYVSRGAWELANQQFQAALALKGDFANALYNLAYVFKQQNQWLKAALALRETQKLIASSDTDYIKVSDELSEARDNLTTQERAAFDGKPNSETISQEGAQLSLPTPPTDLSKVAPDVTLPQDASPPAVTY